MEAMHCGRQEIRWLLTLAGALLWLPSNGQALIEMSRNAGAATQRKRDKCLTTKSLLAFWRNIKDISLLCVAVSLCNSASLLSAPQSVKQRGFPPSFVCNFWRKSNRITQKNTWRCYLVDLVAWRPRDNQDSLVRLVHFVTNNAICK